MFVHGFSFGTGDSPDVEVEVLDYQYGGSGQFATRASQEKISLGEIFTQHSIFGGMPRGDFLYVKWRIKQTGEIHEDRVDLSKRLPQDMTYYTLHFVAKGAQLYVYLVPPTPPHTPPLNEPGISGSVWPSSVYRASFTDEGAAKYIKKLQIYPDVAKQP